MPETFVPLREWLCAPVEPAADETVAEPIEDGPVVEDVIAEEEIDEWKSLLGHVRRFRAALADTLEACAHELLTDISAEILARELRIAPSDVRAIVNRAIERYGAQPVRIRLNPQDAHHLDGLFPIVCDEQLRAGDVVLETTAGTIDATLGARLERVLAGIRS